MKKQLLLCACVAVSSLLASNLEESQQQGKSAPTTIDDLPMEMQFYIAGDLSLRDLINLSQADIACNRVVKSMKISQINVNSKDFFEGSNIDAKIIEILQKCSATSPMNAFETMSILVNNTSILLRFDEYSKYQDNPSLEFIITGLKLCQGIEDGYSRVNIIEALADVPAHKVTDAFTRVAATLCQGIMDGDAIVGIIKVLANLPAQTLCHGINYGSDIAAIIESIAHVPAENYEALTITAQTLCQDITDKRTRAEIIKALANGPPELHEVWGLYQWAAAGKYS